MYHFSVGMHVVK